MSIIYPDNDNREKRANQLASDISSSIQIQVGYAHELEEKLQHLSDTVSRLLLSLNPNLKPTTTDVPGYATTLQLIDLIALLPGYKAGEYVMTKLRARVKLFDARVNKVRPVPQDEPNIEPDGPNIELDEVNDVEALAGEEQVLAEECELSAELEIGWKAGAVVFALAIAAAVEGIGGAVMRDKLREKIHQLIKARETQKQHEIRARLLLDQVSYLLITTQIHENGLPYTEEEIEALVVDSIPEYQQKIDEVNAEQARDELAEIDQVRNAWTNEDH